MEERFPNIGDTEPELLAHHYTEAKQSLKAIPLWQKAGGLALKRLALAEAIAHVNKGLDLVVALPSSAERDGKELDLRCLLGTAWNALKGPSAQEVWDSLHPALKLATSLRRNDALLRVLFGLCENVFNRGPAAESLRWATQMLEAAEAHHDPDLLVAGHAAALVSYFWLGELIKAREHADQVLALYSEERHGHLVGILNHDPKTVSLMHRAEVTWLLGYPEQAVKINGAADDHARQLGHPVDLGFALTVGAEVFDYLGEPHELLKRVAEAERVGRENSLPVLTEFLGPVLAGTAMIRKGQFPEGMVSLRAGLAVWEAGGGRITSPYFKTVLAEGMAQLGDLDGALDLIDESIAQVERPGWEERWYYAEILRIKGWLLSLKGDLEGAERNYIASLDWARQQQAKSWELRTATSYARLLRDQGRAREAYELLAPVYNWFTEGFGTKDLEEAKALLDELADTAALPASGSLGAS
jgi:predicted ATPase